MSKILNFVLIVLMCAGFSIPTEMRGISDFEKNRLMFTGLWLGALAPFIWNSCHKHNISKAKNFTAEERVDQEYLESLLREAKKISVIVPKNHAVFIEPNTMDVAKRIEALKEYINDFGDKSLINNSGYIATVFLLLAGATYLPKIRDGFKSNKPTH